MKFNKQIRVILIPLETTTSYLRGCEKGPEQLWSAWQSHSYLNDIYDPEKNITISEINSYIAHPIINFQPIQWNENREAIRIIESQLRKEKYKDDFFFSIGAEHTASIAPVSIIKENNPDIDFGVVQFDAHGDLRDKFENDKYSHACVMRRITEFGIPVAGFGIRSVSTPEKEMMETKAFHVYDWELKNETEKVKDRLVKLPDNIYITVDLDVFDPSIMPAVGTPEPGGINFYDFQKILDIIFKTKKIIGMDIVEFMPITGIDGSRSLELAVKVGFEMLSRLIIK